MSSTHQVMEDASRRKLMHEMWGGVEPALVFHGEADIWAAFGRPPLGAMSLSMEETIKIELEHTILG